jgi:hypothetical protein
MAISTRDRCRGTFKTRAGDDHHLHLRDRLRPGTGERAAGALRADREYCVPLARAVPRAGAGHHAHRRQARTVAPTRRRGGRPGPRSCACSGTRKVGRPGGRVASASDRWGLERPAARAGVSGPAAGVERDSLKRRAPGSRTWEEIDKRHSAAHEPSASDVPRKGRAAQGNHDSGSYVRRRVWWVMA